jgi:hypothetical protein
MPKPNHSTTNLNLVNMSKICDYLDISWEYVHALDISWDHVHALDIS